MLNDEQMKEMEQLVLDGVTPEDLSTYFNMSVSSVHNYKRELRERGLKVPDIRGKRPSGMYKPSTGKTEQLHTIIHEKEGKYIYIVVNGVDFHISKQVRSVRIDEEGVLVNI
jgi:transposase